MAEMPDIAGNIARVQERIADAAAKAGRAGEEIKLMLAAKYQPAENLIAAMEAGVNYFGHNLIPQLVEAEAAISTYPHFTSVIGHIQSNKLSTAMDHAQRIDTVDSLKNLQRINRRQEARITAGEANAPYPVLLQVNSAAAPTQFGCPPQELLELASRGSELPQIEICGLMTIGANTEVEKEIHASFALLQELGTQMQSLPGLAGAKILSMGMTSDLEIAIAHGSTEVRVGTAVFGPRAQK